MSVKFLLNISLYEEAAWPAPLSITAGKGSIVTEREGELQALKGRSYGLSGFLVFSLNTLHLSPVGITITIF